MVTETMKLKDACLLEEKVWNLASMLKAEAPLCGEQGEMGLSKISWACQFFFHFLFIWPRKDILSYCLALSGWVPLVCEHSRSFPVATIGWVRRKESKLGSQARKGRSIRGKQEGDRPLRRARVLPFWQGLSYTPLMKNSLRWWLIFSL